MRGKTCAVIIALIAMAIGSMAHSGEAALKVVNAWVNRLIGDQQPGATKYTFADVKPYKASSPLLPSGLLGPVAVVREE